MLGYGTLRLRERCAAARTQQTPYLTPYLIHHVVQADAWTSTSWLGLFTRGEISLPWEGGTTELRAGTWMWAASRPLCTPLGLERMCGGSQSSLILISVPTIAPSLSKNKMKNNYCMYLDDLFACKGLAAAYLSQARLDLHLGDQKSRAGAAVASDLSVKL